MLHNKCVLLIAGGGTLGTYVSEELLRLGADVEVICPEEKISNNEHLTFHQSLATEMLLRNLFSKLPPISSPYAGVQFHTQAHLLQQKHLRNQFYPSWE